ncbi:class I SAM-dependent methyltransferase [Micromonospora phytophila]|uniref:class I SAM-dependent methyltransferase n=1 Tax=Micromonospora phytophila TaxID=709888 RepID=UPI00202E0CB2|nr:class I SAM-dependent methyltransferase [Micromonospora phytophila]MCM0677669.1 class I SAM-dependent methyltransferase [Micromonospora phytophila]
MNELTARNRAAYDRIAPAFAARNAGMPPAYLALADDFQRRSAGPVLDLGCGVGRDLVFWAKRNVVVMGLDLSRGMLDHARADTTAPLVQADMLHLPFADAAFGGVWCSASLLHLPKALAPSALAEMRRVLRRGGALLTSLQEGAGETWDGWRGENADRFFARYDPDGATALLADAGFTPLRLERDVSPVGQRWIVHLAMLDVPAE